MLNGNKQTTSPVCKPWDEKAERLTLELANNKVLGSGMFLAEVKKLTGCSKHECEAYIRELIRTGRIKSARDKTAHSNAAKVIGSPKLIDEYLNSLFPQPISPGK